MNARRRTAPWVLRLLGGLTLLVVGAAVLAASEGVVNINTAGEAQLMLLPRVGPSLAKKIVEYREANGEFKNPDELVLVPGVGDRTYELMEPFVSVKGDTTLKEKAKAAAKPAAAKPAAEPAQPSKPAAAKEGE
jgi:competence protein ComEA